VAAYASSTGPTLTNAETGAKFNREETLAGTTNPVPKPNANGTNYSFHKPYRLNVTGTDSTSLSNLRYRMSGAPATGLTLWFRDDGASYVRGNSALTDNGTTNDAAPSGFGAAATSDTVYDTGSYSAGTTGGKGDYISIAMGVSNLYEGGAGTNISLPSMVVTYDEL
jgi:hypothetical protein